MVGHLVSTNSDESKILKSIESIKGLDQAYTNTACRAVIMEK